MVILKFLKLAAYRLCKLILPAQLAVLFTACRLFVRLIDKRVLTVQLLLQLLCRLLRSLAVHLIVAERLRLLRLALLLIFKLIFRVVQ